MSTLRKITDLLNPEYKRRLVVLIGISILSSMIEAAGISAVIPFVSVSTNFSLIETNSIYSRIYHGLGFQSPLQFVVVFGILLILFYAFRGALTLIYFHMLAGFGFGFHRAIVQNLFARYLSLNYLDFTNKNSAALTKTIITEGQLVGFIISDALLLMSEVIIVVILYSLLLFFSWKITLLITAVLALNVVFLTRFISKRVKAVGVKREASVAKLYELLNVSFKNFKLNKLHDLKGVLCDYFERASMAFQKAQTLNLTFTHFPRLFLETGSMIVIVSLMLYLVWKEHGDVRYILPTMSVLFLALYRLLPSINRIMAAYNTIVYNHRALEVVYADSFSTGEELGREIVAFERSIDVRNLHLSYPGKEPTLKDVNLVIRKGEKVAFVGESGVGKSTLVDLIIGLHRPSKGEIRVDETVLGPHNIRDWRSKIGYVPQQVYLFDGTVGENVVFYREFDKHRLAESLKQANIFEFLNSLNGFDTKVGEGGIQLSGGQVQRIAIARALYGNPDVLVFDEATSSLDTDTEAEVMNEIYQIIGDKTLIVIAHRLNTVQRCDRIFRLVDGGVYAT